ncbi:MAG: glycosyltransferase family 39 protein [Planctomycetes bacterium]|nr:glycosyltransferase family 39 protein [Planctomycetota bacterium]
MEPAPEAMPEDALARGLRLLTVLCWLLIFVPALFSRGPWHVDDLRYVEVARQMGEYGEFLVPHINGDVYGEKPPGYFIPVVLLHWVTGADYLLSARLLSALSVVATGLMLVHLGKLLFGSRAIGWLGAACFSTMLFVVDRGQRSLIDTFLLPLVTAGTVTLFRAGLARSWHARLGWGAAASVALGWACVTKGPVGVAVPALGALALGLVARGRQGVSIAALVTAPVLGGALTLGWLMLAAQQAGDWYLDRMLFRQSAGRAVESFHHAEPFWFFLLVMPPVMLPALLFVPHALRQAWQRRREPAARGALGLLAWSAAVLVFFSAISGKRTGYVLPMFAPLGLAAAWGVLQPQASRWLAWPARALAWVALAAAPLLAAMGLLHELLPPDLGPPELAELRAAQPGDAWPSFVLCGLLLGLVAWRGARASAAGQPLGAVAAGLLAVALLSLGAHVTVVPAMDASRSANTFGAEVARQWNRDEPLVSLGPHKDGLDNYFTNRRRTEPLSREALAERAAQPGALWVIALSQDWTRMPEAARAGFVLRAEADFNNKHWLLLHRPAP